MKKTVYLLAILLLMMTVPALAQDDQDGGTATQTIAQIAASQENTFSTLLQAVDAAEPVVAETLSGGGPITVFAPTNRAFANLAAEFDFELSQLLADQELVTGLLLYHVVNDALTASDLQARDGNLVNPLLPGTAFSVSVSGGTVVLNDIVRVQQADILASNGVLHVTADVMFPLSLQDDLETLGDSQPTATPAPAEAQAERTPAITPSGDSLSVTGEEEDVPDEPATEIVTVSTFPSQLTLAGRVVSDPRYDTLETILREVAPDYLDLLNSDSEYTLLAPTNGAFVNLLATLDISLEDALEFPVVLRQILAYHVIEGTVTAAELREADGERVQTILFNPVDEFQESIGVSIESIGTARRITLNDVVQVRSSDREATNGVTHSVDNVLLPQVAIDTLTEAGVLEPTATPTEDAS